MQSTFQLFWLHFAEQFFNTDLPGVDLYKTARANADNYESDSNQDEHPGVVAKTFDSTQCYAQYERNDSQNDKEHGGKILRYKITPFPAAVN
jgi:hypothetical protein